MVHTIDLLADFDALPSPPDVASGFAVRSRELRGLPHAWVGKDSRGRPAILVSVEGDLPPDAARIELSNFSYYPRARCLMGDDAGESERELAVLRCQTDERDLHAWFLRAGAALLVELVAPVAQRELDAAVEHLVRLFVALGRPGSGSVQGLWGELVLLANAQEPELLSRAWHGDPMETHDFIAGSHRAEVKTALGSRREHQFSLDQLTCPEGDRLCVLSILLRPSASGPSIVDLVDQIAGLVEDAGLVPKLHQVVADTLGTDWRRSTDQRYSVEDALDSLRIYDAGRVPRVSRAGLPPEVRDVRFLVEMWGLVGLDDAAIAEVPLWAAFSRPRAR